MIGGFRQIRVSACCVTSEVSACSAAVSQEEPTRTGLKALANRFRFHIEMEAVAGLDECEDGSALVPMPIISVSRALRYHVESIDFDYAELWAYYASLPYPDKPALEDCRIHISALACLMRRRKGRSLPRGTGTRQQQDSGPPGAIRLRESYVRKRLFVDGIHLVEPEEAALFDPLAPRADVLLFFGWSVFLNEPSRFVAALERQIAAYARGRQAWLAVSREEERMREKLKGQALELSEELGGLAGTVEGAAEEGIPSLISLDSPLHILISVGVGISEHVVTSRSHRRQLRQTRNGLINCIVERGSAEGAELLPVSLNAAAVRVKLRRGDRLQDTSIRVPCGRKWPGSSLDHVIDRDNVARSLGKQPLQAIVQYSQWRKRNSA